MAVPKRKTPRAKTRQRRASNWRLAAPARSTCPQLRRGQAAAHRVRQLRLVRRPPGARRRVVDARRDEPHHHRGRRDGRRPRPRRDRRGRGAGRRRARRRRAARRRRGRDRAAAARRRRERRRARRRPPRSSRCDEPAGVGAHEEGLVDRASRAELVRDGKADAMVGAGNTGADDGRRAAAHGPHQGRARPAIAVPIPVPGAAPQILVDGGATVDCTARVARAVRGDGPRVRRASGSGIDEPTRRPALERRGAGQGRRRCARPSYALLERRCPGSSATSRAATSCTRRRRRSSPTASPATSR